MREPTQDAGWRERGEKRWRVGSLIAGRYEVLSELGRGGMGAVFRVHDPQTGRDLALKLNLRRSSEQARARFVREAQALARVRHPAVARIHDVGDAPEGLYLTMDLIEGESLAERLGRTGPFDPATAAKLTAEVSEGLVAIHAAGLVHRDIKPANVMLHAEDDQPVLLDLGAALDETAERLTATGQMIGTPDTMSPEQISGGRELDARTDVYGLGVLLYMTLCARPPFQEGNLLALAAAITSREPTWPQAPGELVRVLQQAMAKAPEDRYPTVAALRDDLLRYASGERVSASGVRRAARPATLVLGVAALVTCLALAAGLTLGLAGEAPSPGASPPTPPAPRTPSEARLDPEQELDQALVLPGSSRDEALGAWLRANRQHPRAREAWRPYLERRLAEPTLVTILPEATEWTLAVMEGQVYAFREDLLRVGPKGLETVVSFERPLKIQSVTLGPEGWLALARRDKPNRQNLFLVSPDGRVHGRRVGRGGPDLRRLASAGDWLWAGSQGGALIRLSWAELRAGSEVAPQARMVLREKIRALLPLEGGRLLAASAGSLENGNVDTANDVVVWDPSQPQEPLARRALPGPCYYLELVQRADGQEVVAGLKWVQELHVLSLPSLEPAGFLASAAARPTERPTSMGSRTPAHSVTIRGVALLPNGLMVSAASRQVQQDPRRTLRVWDVARRLELTSIELPGSCWALTYGAGRLWTLNGARIEAWDLLPD